MACSTSAARIAWTPLFEYSSPVYIRTAQACAAPIARASSTTVAAGTPVIVSTRSGVNRAT